MAGYKINRTSFSKGSSKSAEGATHGKKFLLSHCLRHHRHAELLHGAKFTGRGRNGAGHRASINRLAGSVRECGGRVVWVQTTTDKHRKAWSVRHELLLPERAEIRLQAMETGAEGFALWPTLDVRSGDMRIVKTLYSAFAPGIFGSTEQLRSSGIEYVLIGGTYTNVCCQASAQDAMMLNFRTIMVSDCNAASTAAAHAATLDNFFEFFGDVSIPTRLLLA